jgi:hypothetical protein
MSPAQLSGCLGGLRLNAERNVDRDILHDMRHVN